jgi:hypothetical protein
MIIEIIAILSLIQCVNVLSRLIERRRDVFYYVSRPEPRW